MRTHHGRVSALGLVAALAGGTSNPDDPETPAWVSVQRGEARLHELV